MMNSLPTHDRITKICIVGGGTAGWMTAAAMSRILGPEYATITLVESDDIGTVGVGEATIPQIGVFNRLVGINEDEFVRNTKGSFKLGIEFVNWGKQGHSYFHPFGAYGVDMEGVSFYSFWLRLHRQGLVPYISEYSLQAKAAAFGKFMRPINAGQSPLTNLAYAFHFDAGLYAFYLRGISERQGVRRVEGKIVDVHQRGDDGFIEAVQLENGTRIDAELFIDCSGFRGLLIEQTLHAGYSDWSEWLPCNRAVTIPCVKAETTPPYTRATARTAGWQWRIPLQHRIGNGHVYCSNYISDDEAAATLLANLDGEPLADTPRLIRFTTGMRRQSWSKNCVAIGLSSGFMEPLESTSIHMIQSAIARLMSNFPDRGFADIIRDHYNRLIISETEQIRDFLIGHYHITSRDDSPFWQYCRNMHIPPNLQEKISLFQNGGRAFRENEELFNSTSWFALMMGQGLQPKRHDPVADLLTLDETKKRLDDIQQVVLNSANYMPSHDEFIKQNCAATM
ncbi:MAG: tryptophan halogenase family protein [Steroidobacter sp.]